VAIQYSGKDKRISLNELALETLVSGHWRKGTSKVSDAGINFMEYENLKDDFKNALSRLDQALTSLGITVQILLGGASAMKILGLIPRDSNDLDNFRKMESAVLSLIASPKIRGGLDEDWLNDHAFDVYLPDGAESRVQEVATPLKAVMINILSGNDLLIMKVAAAVMRGEERDKADLRLAGISLEIFEKGVDHIREKYRPEEAKFQKYQDDDIEVLRHELFG
jgi:hypothetical protein